MHGTTFGLPAFSSPAGRVEPEAEVHFGLLLVLAAAEPEGVPRDEVAALLWPAVTLDAARHSLRQTMYRLRQLGMPVQARRGMLLLEERSADIDLRRLVRGSTERELLTHVGTQPFLPGYAPQIGEGFAVWLQDLRDRVDRVRRRALAEAVREARHAARFGDIHRLAPALLALDPLNETATLCLAEALVMDGSKVEAILMLEAYEAEVGQVSEALRIPARALRKRVSEAVDDSLLPRKFEVPFVGRVEEFRQLRNLFLAVRGGAARCAVITGEPGIGKTRIATELLRVGILDGAQAVTHQCSSGDTLTPLSSLLGITTSLLGQPGALGCGHEHLSYLRRLVHPDPAHPVASGMSPDVAYAQLVYSLAELVAAIADEAPLILFIDDAHRLHQTSWRVFTDVVTRVPDKRVLLIMTARQLPEWYPTLGINGSAEPVLQTRLVPFDRGDSLDFLDKWTEKNQVSLEEGDVQRFSSQSGGNPFYLGELAAHRGRGGVGDSVPATIRSLIELQFTALSTLSQRVLLTIHLLQGRATLQRVATVLGTRPLAFLTALQELEGAGLLKEHATEVRLKHDLVGEVTQAHAPSSVLSYLRSTVATALEEEATLKADFHLLSAAVDLWHATGDLRRFATLATRLGHHLLSTGLTREAAATFARVRRSGVASDEVAVAAVYESRAHALSNDWDRVVEQPQLPEDILTRLPEEHQCSLALDRMEATAWHFGDLPATSALLQMIEDTSLSASLRLRAATQALIISDNAYGAYPLSTFLQAIDMLLQSVGATDGAMLPRLILATLNRERGDVRALASALREAAATPAEAVRNARHVAYALQRTGHTSLSREAYADSLAAATRLGLGAHVIISLDRLISIAAHLHDTDEASRLELLLAASPHPAQGSYQQLAHLRGRTMAAWIRRSREQVPQLSEDFGQLRSPWTGERGQAELAIIAIFLSDLSDEALGPSWERHVRGHIAEVLSRGAVDQLAVACARCLARDSKESSRKFVQRYFLQQRTESERMHRCLIELLPEGCQPLAEAPVTRR